MIMEEEIYDYGDIPENQEEIMEEIYNDDLEPKNIHLSLWDIETANLFWGY